MRADRMQKVRRLVAQARRALDAGDCLKAGRLVDRGYVASRGSRKAIQLIERVVDREFERVCVRRHPARL